MVQATKPSLDVDKATVMSLFAVVRAAHALSPRDTGDVGAFKLLVCACEGGPMRLSDLAVASRLDNSTTSRHVTSLEKQKLLRRLPDPNDRRAQLIEATPKANKFLDQMLTSRAKAVGPALSTWNAKDRATLDELLQRLANDMAAEVERNQQIDGK